MTLPSPTIIDSLSPPLPGPTPVHHRTDTCLHPLSGPKPHAGIRLHARRTPCVPLDFTAAPNSALEFTLILLHTGPTRLPFHH